MTKGMAESGDSMDFKNIRPGEEIIADKHPLVVWLVKQLHHINSNTCPGGLIVPNTSTRAITSPAGTTDIWR